MVQREKERERRNQLRSFVERCLINQSLDDIQYLFLLESTLRANQQKLQNQIDVFGAVKKEIQEMTCCAAAETHNEEGGDDVGDNDEDEK